MLLVKMMKEGFSPLSVLTVNPGHFVVGLGMTGQAPDNVRPEWTLDPCTYRWTKKLYLSVYQDGAAHRKLELALRAVAKHGSRPKGKTIAEIINTPARHPSSGRKSKMFSEISCWRLRDKVQSKGLQSLVGDALSEKKPTTSFAGQYTSIERQMLKKWQPCSALYPNQNQNAHRRLMMETDCVQKEAYCIMHNFQAKTCGQAHFIT